jgi:hypothetical protein
MDRRNSFLKPCQTFLYKVWCPTPLDMMLDDPLSIRTGTSASRAIRERFYMSIQFLRVICT